MKFGESKSESKDGVRTPKINKVPVTGETRVKAKVKAKMASERQGETSESKLQRLEYSISAIQLCNLFFWSRAVQPCVFSFTSFTFA